MRLIRQRLLAVAATVCVFTVTAPVSGAGAEVGPWPVGAPVDTLGGETGPMLCGANAPFGIGSTGGTFAEACGVTSSYIDTAIGAESSVVGPTIIGGVVAAPINVSAGPVQE